MFHPRFAVTLVSPPTHQQQYAEAVQEGLRDDGYPPASAGELEDCWAINLTILSAVRWIVDGRRRLRQRVAWN